MLLRVQKEERASGGLEFPTITLWKGKPSTPTKAEIEIYTHFLIKGKMSKAR